MIRHVKSLCEYKFVFSPFFVFSTQSPFIIIFQKKNKKNKGVFSNVNFPPSACPPPFSSPSNFSIRFAFALFDAYCSVIRLIHSFHSSWWITPYQMCSLICVSCRASSIVFFLVSWTLRLNCYASHVRVHYLLAFFRLVTKKKKSFSVQSFSFLANDARVLLIIIRSSRVTFSSWHPTKTHPIVCQIAPSWEKNHQYNACVESFALFLFFLLNSW